MGRAACCLSTKKGRWTIDEDEKLKAFITLNGIGNWQRVPEECGIARCGKSCRLRWNKYLRPDIKRGLFTSSEEQKITQLHALVGNRWAFIASHLPMRTGNEIQNYWKTVLKKRQDNQSPSGHRLLKKGVVRAKAKPALPEPTASSTTASSTKSRRGQQSTHVSSSHHLDEWETVRLDAEARLLREAKMKPKLGARPPSVTPVWGTSLADAPVHSTLMLIANRSADLRGRPAAGAVARIWPQHLNATELAVHQPLASPMQILSDPTVNLPFPPLLNHIARHELEPLPFIHKPTYVDETGAVLEILPPSNGRPQTGQLAGDHCISPLLGVDDLLFGQALLSAAPDDWSSAACDQQLQLNSITQTSLAVDNYRIHPPGSQHSSSGSHLLTLSGVQSQEVLGSSMCNDLLIHGTHDDGSDSALHTLVADCCLQVNDAA